MDVSTLPAENSALATEQSDDASQVLGLGGEAPEPASAGQTTGAPAAPKPDGQPAAPAAPAPTEQPSWIPADVLQKHPGLAKFKTLADALEAHAGLEQTFHGFRQRGLDPNTVLEVLSAPDADQPPGTHPEGTEDTGAEGDAAAPADPLDEAPAFLDAFAANPRQFLRSEMRTVVMDTLKAWENARAVGQQTWDAGKSRHPDIDQYSEHITAVFEQFPELLQRLNPAEALDRAYAMVASAIGSPAAVKAATDQAAEAARAETVAQMTGTMAESGRVGASPAPAGSARQADVADDILGTGSGSSPLIIRPA